eukprot:COSAG05_NODE_4930_length_1322_cov_2.040065_2_plen_110_part_00
MAFLIMVLHQLGAAVSPNNPNLKILSFYDTVFEQQKSLLTLAIAENSIANQFHSVGVPSLAPLDNIADGVYKRVGGSVAAGLGKADRVLGAPSAALTGQRHDCWCVSGR